jgi:hypothetical protein
VQNGRDSVPFLHPQIHHLEASRLQSYGWFLLAQTISQEIEKTERPRGKAPVDLVKFAKTAISPILDKGLAEFELAFPNP